MLFTKPKKAIGLDIGTHSIKAVQLSRSGGRLFVEEVGYALVDRNQVNADPVAAHADAVRECLRQLAVQQSCLVTGLPGQTVVIRYPRLSESAKNSLAEAVEREAGQSIPYDRSEVSLDWTLLDEVEEGDAKQLKVLLVAAKHEIIDSRVQILDVAELQSAILGVDSLALADAAEACDFLRVGETVALVNVGLTSASIHFVKDGISNFIRDVNWGAREMIQAIAKEQHCEYEEAERVLLGMSSEAESAPPPVEEAPAPAEAAPVADVLDDPFGGPDALGGDSLLDPLDDELGDAAATPVAAKTPRGPRDARDVLAVPLQRMVSEIRRSFDYYEHQLYERPVDRLILSGGVAELPAISNVLIDELGVETVEVANPATSALVLGDDFSVAPLLEHPSQFMVAVGLAARGMADL